MRRVMIGAVLLFAFAVTVSARQGPEPLFVDVSATASASADRHLVGMRVDRLFSDATSPVLLNVGAHAWVARVERLDKTDVIGFRSWVGTIDGVENSHVSFTERDGVVSGLIDAVSEVHQIRTVARGVYALERVEPSALRGEAEPLIDSSAANEPLSSTTTGNAAADDPGTFDVLLLYTAAAQARQGGAAQMQALASRIITDSNTAFQRSGVTSRMRLVGAIEFAYAEAPSMSADLQAVTNSVTARALRDQYRADLVQLLVQSPDTAVCGIAWLLNSIANTSFNAYSVADVDCAGQYTPTHEMGHNMGSHHAPEDNAINALFPYSYGFKDPARGFRTVMAYSCSGVSCPRVLNFSNPSVLQSGAATGTSTQNNALSINNAANTVANFRQGLATPPPPPTVTPPGAPTGLRSSVLGTTVTLAWNAVTSDVIVTPSAATSYTLLVGSATGTSNLFAGSVGPLTSVTGSVPAGTYFWRVVAVNSAGQSAPSGEVVFTVGGCVPPGAPQNFNFSLSGRTLTLTWAAPGAGGAPATYVIEAGSASMLANLFNAPVGNVTSLTVQAPPGTYFVRVRAQNACGTSAPAAERLIVVP